LIGRKGLQDDLEVYVDRPKYQRLVIEFEKGENPDDAYSRVPYDKGANLLLNLGELDIANACVSPANSSLTEKTIGGLDVFLPYVRDYVETFMGKSITTWQWKDHLYAYFEKNGGQAKVDALNSIDWEVS